MIEILNFDENWHDNYRYAQPVRLPRGTQVITECVYDNTAANIRNRHTPPRRVVYGSNADDEMSDVYLQVTPVHPDERAVLLEDYAAYEARSKLQGYRKTLEQYPQDPWSREGMAACFVTLGEPSKAVSVLEELEKIMPKSLHAIASLGMACYLNGETVRAEQLLRQAIAIDPQYPLAWMGLGQALNAQKKFAEAKHAYESATKLAPGLVDAQLGRSDILLREGDAGKMRRSVSSSYVFLFIAPG